MNENAAANLETGGGKGKGKGKGKYQAPPLGEIFPFLTSAGLLYAVVRMSSHGPCRQSKGSGSPTKKQRAIMDGYIRGGCGIPLSKDRSRYKIRIYQ